MSIFGRESVAKAAAELAEHLSIIDHVKALQVAQKELAVELKLTNDRILELFAEMRALRGELKYECIKETQSIVNSVQGGLNSRLDEVTSQVAVLDSQLHLYGVSQPQIKTGRNLLVQKSTADPE